MWKHKKLFTLFTVIIATLILVACGNSNDVEETSPEVIEEGTVHEDTETEEADDKNADSVDDEEAERIYTFSCASCHGNDFAGQGPFPALTSIGGKYSEEQLTTIIKEGIGTMPAGLVNDEDAILLAKWLSETRK